MFSIHLLRRKYHNILPSFIHSLSRWFHTTNCLYATWLPTALLLLVQNNNIILIHIQIYDSTYTCMYQCNISSLLISMYMLSLINSIFLPNCLNFFVESQKIFCYNSLYILSTQKNYSVTYMRFLSFPAKLHSLTQCISPQRFLP